MALLLTVFFSTGGQIPHKVAMVYIGFYIPQKVALTTMYVPGHIPQKGGNDVADVQLCLYTTKGGSDHDIRFRSLTAKFGRDRASGYMFCQVSLNNMIYDCHFCNQPWRPIAITILEYC